MRCRPGQVVEIRSARDHHGQEIDQLGYCEAVVVEVSTSGEDVLVRLQGTGEEWWVTHRRIKQADPQ